MNENCDRSAISNSTIPYTTQRVVWGRPLALKILKIYIKSMTIGNDKKLFARYLYSSINNDIVLNTHKNEIFNIIQTNLNNPFEYLIIG